MGKKQKTRVGRPAKAVKEVNKVRQVGRWTDHDWELVRKAAQMRDSSVAAWARKALLRAAYRTLR